MPLNNYQNLFVKAAGMESSLNYLNDNPRLAQALIPVSPEAASYRHIQGGIFHAINVVNLLLEGDTTQAESLVDELRLQTQQNSRGVAKDALPILQGLGIIDELLEGGITVPDTNSLARYHHDLDGRHKEASEKYARIQFGKES